ncbi:hypothetical protein T01_10193 [Trichinella spiralis]|uniref:Secreted protein n=1 Tax=Trichinella spiralis TaxID=6334 RepID=A0A0V1BU39_TRISP|nr:hypothetical protein T01_10193 [Trichinella spiralis]
MATTAFKAAASVLLVYNFWPVCNLVKSGGYSWLWSSCPPSAGFYIGSLRHATMGFSGICFIHFCQGFCNIQPTRSLLPRGVSKKILLYHFLLRWFIRYSARNILAKPTLPMYLLYSFTIAGQDTSTKCNSSTSIRSSSSICSSSVMFPSSLGGSCHLIQRRKRFYEIYSAFQCNEPSLHLENTRIQ